MGYKIKSADLMNLRHCAFKTEAKRISKEQGLGGEIIPVFTNLHSTHLIGTLEYGFLGFDGGLHKLEVDPTSKNNLREALIRAK